MLEKFANSNYEIVEKTNKVSIIHYVGDEKIFGSKGRRVYLRKKTDKGWNHYKSFPFIWEDLFSFNRLASRALRLDKCIVFPTKIGKIMGIRKGKVYDLTDRNPIKLFDIKGRAPLYRGIVENENGIFFGEYLSNRDRNEIRIWNTSSDLKKSEVVYTFKKNTIRHIHGLYKDPFEMNRIWLTTGDLNGECYICYTDDNFKTLNKIGNGTQLFRAVGLLFTKEKVCWFTDTNLDQNYFVKMSKKDFKVEKEFPVDNSTLYSCMTTDGYYVASTIVEEGEYIKSNKATIRMSKDCLNWKKVKSYEKDRYSKKYFGFGSVIFSKGSFSSENIWFSVAALKGFHGSALLKIKVD